MLDLGKRGSETGEMSLLLAFCFFTMINTDTPGVWASLVAQSVKKLPAMQETCLGSIPGSGRSPGEGNGNPLQHSYLENFMERGAWWAAVHGVTRVGHDLATKPPPPPESFSTPAGR